MMQRTLGVILGGVLLLSGCAPFDDTGTGYRDPMVNPGLAPPAPTPYQPIDPWSPPPPPPPYPDAGIPTGPIDPGPIDPGRWDPEVPRAAQPTGHPIELHPPSASAAESEVPPPPPPR